MAARIVTAFVLIALSVSCSDSVEPRIWCTVNVHNDTLDTIVVTLDYYPCRTPEYDLPPAGTLTWDNLDVPRDFGVVVIAFTQDGGQYPFVIFAEDGGWYDLYWRNDAWLMALVD